MTTRAEIISKLRELSRQMIELGVEMDYYGGLGYMADRGRELVHAGAIIQRWPDRIEVEEKTE